ncbi:MAG: hypothetical protein WBB01_11075, partial [Phormidesmis sp.]
AWVSTTYSAQGKTADRVLALMSNKTTNREAFYVAVSRAKHGLKLYAADRDELLRRAQISKTKENASDYIPLFKVRENYAETQKEAQQRNEPSSAGDSRDIGQRTGAGVGERLAQEFAAFPERHSGTRSANESVRARCAGDGREFDSLAGVLSEQVEPLSVAVAEYAERAELARCEGELAGAVAAIDYGFKQLEQAAKDRNQLAAAVDRLDAAVRAKAINERPTSVAKEVDLADSVSKEGDYGALWQHYSQGVAARSETELDYRVGRRAFEDGVAQRSISLMLASESSVVENIYRSYGKSQAMKYVNQMARRICQRQTSQEVQRPPSKRQIELE